MLQPVVIIMTIISCVFGGSLYGDENKQLFDGDDIKTQRLDNYMKQFADNMKFCDKGEINGCMNKEEFKKSMTDRFIINGKKMNPYFDYKVLDYKQYPDHAIEQINVEFAVKESGCTITKHESHEIHYKIEGDKKMVKKVVIKNPKQLKRVCGNNNNNNINNNGADGDKRKLLMNDPVPIKVKPHYNSDYYKDLTTESPTTPQRVWTTINPTINPTVNPTPLPTTPTPTTPQPTTSNPTTSYPTTGNPTTMHPTTPAPTTAEPTTANPTTGNPTTSQPTTMNPTTANPTTTQPTTMNPTTMNPTTMNPTTMNPTRPPLPVPPIATLNPTTAVPTPPQGQKVTTLSPTTTTSTVESSTTQSPTSWQKSSWSKSSGSRRNKNKNKNKKNQSSRRLLNNEYNTKSDNGYGYYVETSTTTTTKSPTKKVWLNTPSPTATTLKPSRSPTTPTPTTPTPTTPAPTAPICLECGDIIRNVYPLRDVWLKIDLSFNAQRVIFNACNSEIDNIILELYDSSSTQLIASQYDACLLIIEYIPSGLYNLKLSADVDQYQYQQVDGEYEIEIICEDTPSPTTPTPITPSPTTPSPTTPFPTTPLPTTPAPTTPAPTTPSPTTPSPTTPSPTTPAPTTPAPITPSPTTPSPATPSPTTPAPTTPSPTTPSPTTPLPTTPLPTTPSPTTPLPTTPSPTTPNPTTPAPTTPICLECGDMIRDVYPGRDVWFKFDLSFNVQKVMFSACNSEIDNIILKLYDSSSTQLIASQYDECLLIIESIPSGLYNLKLSADVDEYQYQQVDGEYEIEIICEDTPSPTTPSPTTPSPTLPPNEGFVSSPSLAPTRQPESNGYWPTPKPVENTPSPITPSPITPSPSFPPIPIVITPLPITSPLPIPPIATPSPITKVPTPPNEGDKVSTPSPTNGYWQKSHKYDYDYDYDYDRFDIGKYDNYNGGKWYKYGNKGKYDDYYGYDRYDDGRGYKKYGKKKGGKRGKYGKKY